MNITERFAQELCKDENIREAFIREGLIPRLELNRWIMDDTLPNWIGYYIDKKVYGVNSGGWFYMSDTLVNPNDLKANRYATPAEALEKLSNFARTKGFKGTFEVVGGDLKCNGFTIMKEGVWLTIEMLVNG